MMGTQATLERPIEAAWPEWVTPEDDGEEEGTSESRDVGPDDEDDDDDE